MVSSGWLEVLPRFGDILNTDQWKMGKIKLLFVITGLFLASSLWSGESVRAIDTSCASLSGDAKVSCYEKKVVDIQTQEKTLSSQIGLINSQISLTKSKIDLTQNKLERLSDNISSVSGKIVSLEDSLNRVSNIFANRVVQTYITGRSDPFIYLLTSANFSDLWQRMAYLRLVQKHDQTVMLEMAASRKNYSNQKQLLEEKKKQQELLSAQLKAEKNQLDRQNSEKQSLLEVTRNDETRYQQLLADARRELSALQSALFTGKKNVKKGDVIGLMGNTGFSFGAHLHFGVYSLSEGQADSFNYNSGASNPLDYLKGQSLSMDSGACYDKTSGENFGNGSWDWPMDGPRISQCFGRTPFSWIYANGLHEGLDMYNNENTAIKAVDDGVAYYYRGSGSLGNNVRVFHPNGKMTLYLHLQ